MIPIKTPEQLAKMRVACEISAKALALAKESCKAGVTTAKINEIVHRYITSRGATPSFLGYDGFPASVCISVNDTIIHGIPSRKELLKNGDIVSIDVGALYDGFHGDNAATVAVGEISEDAKRLIEVTERCFHAGRAAAVAGNRVGDIGHAVEATARANGCGVVRDYVGHGVGRELHESPEIPNFGRGGRGARLVAGMTVAIEPMLTLGSGKCELLADEWTVKSTDRSLAAHYEHTILITDGEPIILTV